MQPNTISIQFQPMVIISQLNLKCKLTKQFSASTERKDHLFHLFATGRHRWPKDPPEEMDIFCKSASRLSCPGVSAALLSAGRVPLVPCRLVYMCVLCCLHPSDVSEPFKFEFWEKKKFTASSINSRLPVSTTINTVYANHYDGEACNAEQSLILPGGFGGKDKPIVLFVWQGLFRLLRCVCLQHAWYTTSVYWGEVQNACYRGNLFCEVGDVQWRSARPSTRSGEACLMQHVHSPPILSPFVLYLSVALNVLLS